MIKLEVPPDLLDNICMMNKKDVIEDFVIGVSEMISAYNERGMSYDMDKLLGEAFHDLPMKTEWIPDAIALFDFDDPDAGWLVWEAKAIRKWGRETFFA